MEKEIPNTAGLYCASRDGNIFKVDGTKLSKTDSHGYDTVRLTINKKRLKDSVHRLMAKTFLDNPSSYNEVNHIDCNKKNNNIANLEWCSRMHNVRHANENNLINYSKKLTKVNVLSIRALSVFGFKNREIAKEYLISESTICEIVKRRTWKNV